MKILGPDAFYSYMYGPEQGITYLDQDITPVNPDRRRPALRWTVAAHIAGRSDGKRVLGVAAQVLPDGPTRE